MVWDPAANAAVTTEARPEASTFTLDANTVAPSWNVTVPAGTPLAELVVEVKVTDWPNTEGFVEESTEVVVGVPALALTTWGEAASLPLLPSQPLLPVKVAVTVWLPTASVDVLNEAWPVASTVTLEASAVAPSVKVTVPVGTPPVPVTVAVNVTD